MKYIRSFSGRNVLITGAAGGIGAALARRLFFEENASLILVDKDLEGLKKLRDDLLFENSKHVPVNEKRTIQINETDLSSLSAIDTLCTSIKDTAIDVLINNAGIVYTGSFQKMDIENFDRVLKANLCSAVHLTHHLLPKIVERKGSIVFIASGAGLVASGVANAYSTSKFGLVGFSEALRAELHGRAGVTTLCPGFVNTNIMENSLSSLKFPQSGENKRINELDGYVRKLGVDPARFAKIVVHAIKKNRGLVPFGKITTASHFTKRISSSLADYCNFILFRNLKRRGVID